MRWSSGPYTCWHCCPLSSLPMQPCNTTFFAPESPFMTRSAFRKFGFGKLHSCSKSLTLSACMVDNLHFCWRHLTLMPRPRLLCILWVRVQSLSKIPIPLPSGCTVTKQLEIFTTHFYKNPIFATLTLLPTLMCDSECKMYLLLSPKNTSICETYKCRFSYHFYVCELAIKLATFLS